MISDETAYRRYLNGEEQAADLLVERYGDALTLYINARIRDAHEAEDLMIEAFSLIFAKERPITGTGSFKAYLYKTARNLALRHSRKHRIPFLHMDDLDFEPQSELLSDAALIQSERRSHLYAALEQLKAEFREALYLVYFESMSYNRGGLGYAKDRAADHQSGLSRQAESENHSRTGGICICGRIGNAPVWCMRELRRSGAKCARDGAAV